MRIVKKRFWKTVIVFLCLLALSGCRRVPEPKTMILPVEEMEQGVALQGEEGDRYAVRKIYSRDYVSLWYGGYTAFLPGTEEHKVRLTESSGEGAMMKTMDYRYGFYDKESFAVGEWMDSLALTVSWEWGSIDERRMEKEFVSPDGKYLLYMRSDLSRMGPELYLMDLEMQEERLLLSADEEGFSGDDYMILTAWSRDGSTLCYGFYPRRSNIWNESKKDRLLFYYLNLETGNVVNRLNYSYAGVAGKTDDLQGTQLYIDRNGEKILTVFASDSAYIDEEVCLDFFCQTIPEPGLETEGVVIPNTMRCTKGGRFYPDAESGCVYISPEGGVIDCVDASDGIYKKESLEIEAYRYIRDFCVLDGGEAYVTAECNRDGTEEAGGAVDDICLYTATDFGMTRRVLYQNAGSVIRLQYDPVYRRILAETGNAYLTEQNSNLENKNAVGIEWDEARRILVLEF